MIANPYQARHEIANIDGVPVYRLGDWNSYLVEDEDNGDFTTDDKVEALLQAVSVSGRRQVMLDA